MDSVGKIIGTFQQCIILDALSYWHSYYSCRYKGLAARETESYVC